MSFECQESDMLGFDVVLADSFWRGVTIGFRCLDRNVMAMRLIVENI